jgi:hypothetical protein
MAERRSVVFTSLKPGQRAYLVEIAESSDVINAVEHNMRSRQKRFLLIYLSIIPLAGIAFGLSAALLESIGLSSREIDWLAIGAYTVLFPVLYLIIRSFPEILAFRRLIRCIPSIDRALNSPPASRSRKRAAKKLARCARAMLRYRPLIPLGSYKRILSQEATRASQVLRYFTNPVMLGTDEDLKQAKVALARAAIRVGTFYWGQVGDLKDLSINRSVQRRVVFSSSLFPLLTGIVVPVVAALITALVKS